MKNGLLIKDRGGYLLLCILRSVTVYYARGSPPFISLSLNPRDHFYQFGEVNSIHLVPAQKCAFINFTSRHSAEQAASGSFNKLVLKGISHVPHIMTREHATLVYTQKYAQKLCNCWAGLQKNGWLLLFTVPTHNESWTNQNFACSTYFFVKKWEVCLWDMM